ncbi:unnamed protein product [Closterium sp. Yama58-4]|nr:unnamed protein product [Closterium sp. Yama58-4]
MARLARSSSANPSVPVNEDQGGQGDGGDEVYGGICEEGLAERLAEKGRAGEQGSKTEGARDSSGNSSSDSSHESAADDEKGLRAFLRHCRQRVRRASNTSADESSAVGEEGGEGKATAAGGPLKRSLTEDATGEMMARSSMGGGSLQGFTRGASLSRSTSDVLQEAEMDEMDREVLQEAFVRVAALQQRVQHYRDLGGFVVLMALFITILYLQADSSRSYEITAAHAVLFPPGMRQDASNTFNGPDDFYNWLNTSIVQAAHSSARALHSTPLFIAPPFSPPPLQSLWTDPVCGDGSCERPFQYPAFGRFGCEADCGTFPNLTSIVVRFSSQLDTQHAADETSWNLCMVNPVSLCWYESFQPFPLGTAEASVAVDIPDGDWVVVLNAPAGGIRGTVHAPPPGTRRFSIVGAASTVELATWGYCAHDDDVDAANQVQPSGGAAGSPPDICRDRLTALQVAVSRALFTMAKDRCLAGRAPGAEAMQVAGATKHTLRGPGSVSWRIVACLCTMLGGPSTTLDECQFTNETGQQVVKAADMYSYLQRTHVSGGRIISSQHMRRFVQMMVAALRSVTPMADADAARLNTLMHAFDDAIVTSDAVGCSQGAHGRPVVVVGADAHTQVVIDDVSASRPFLSLQAEHGCRGG